MITDFIGFIAHKITLILESTIAIIILCIIIIGVFYFLFLLVKSLLNKLNGDEQIKYEFITIIAHKFRTPLTHLKWISENLIASETDPYKKESLMEMQKSNERLINLTNTLIEITDKNKSSESLYKFESLPICKIVKAVGESSKNLFHEKNIFFSVECDSGEKECLIDRVRMEFVISTLLENACIYTPPGKQVLVNVYDMGNKVAISVKDDGIGIEKHDLPKIFTKFFRTENAEKMDTEGFGVGLYLAKSVINQHKGTLEVNSAGLNQGSEFVITLPAVK